MSYIVEATVGRKEKMDKNIDVMTEKEIKKLTQQKEELFGMNKSLYEEKEELSKENQEKDEKIEELSQKVTDLEKEKEELIELNEKLNKQLNEPVNENENISDKNISEEKATVETKKSKRSAE